MNFKDYLNSQSLKIDNKLKILLDQWGKEVGYTSNKLIPLASAFKKANFGGKRIRAILAKLGYEIAGGKDEKEILNVAAAYEVFHTSILAHDDIIDQSVLRRGQPSLYKTLGGGHYGTSLAICLGDIGFFLATKLISESNFPQKEKNVALQFFAKTMLDTAVGQMLDIELPYLDQRWEEDVMAIMKLKTAKYTISAPLQLGAILAGAEGSLIRVLGEFGENLGTAFQIQDDILGVFGSEQELGKSTTSDIEEGKNTLLITYAQKVANLSQRKLLKRYYGQGDCGTKGLQAVKAVFKETGALDYAHIKELEYVSRTKKMIPGLSSDTQMRKLLEEMTDYLVQRTR